MKLRRGIPSWDVPELLGGWRTSGSAARLACEPREDPGAECPGADEDDGRWAGRPRSPEGEMSAEGMSFEFLVARRYLLREGREEKEFGIREEAEEEERVFETEGREVVECEVVVEVEAVGSGKESVFE